MNAEKFTTSVTIMGKAYRIACPITEQDTLRQAADYLNHHMQTIQDNGKIFGIDRIAIMAALNITYEKLTMDSEKHTLEEENYEKMQQVHEITKELSYVLERCAP